MLSRNKVVNRGLVALALVAILAFVIACGSPTPAPQPTTAPAAQPTSAPAAQPTAAPAATTAPAATSAPAAGKVKIGISMSDFATERWKKESDLMTQLLTAKGYDVVVQEANHDVKLQNDQIDNMVAQGVKGLIIVAEDGDAAATAVDKAAAAGVKVIAYDRLIKTSNIAAYLSFDNVEVGRQQAMGVMKALDIDNWDVATKGPAKVVQLAGSPTDNNATLFTKGQTEVLQPYVDSGKIKIVAQQGVDNWDPANAEKLMENILTAQQNKIDAVVASNDGTALGALQAMKAQGLAGKVPISGQDATADGCNSIVKGELTVTIMKDIRNLAPQATDLMDGLLKGTPPTLKQFTLAELTVDPSKTGNVQALFLPVQQVTKANVYDLVVKSGFQAYDDVYNGVPDADRPPKVDVAGAPTAAATTAPTAAAQPTAAPAASGEKIKIGISMSDFATERWKKESDLMSQLLQAKGYDVVVQEANHDVKLQNDQIDNMVAQGVKGLIVVAEDGDAAATAVDKAAAAGVKVIAYDRLIKTANIAAYLSFDNVEVGRQQAEGIMKAIDADNWDVATKGPAKVVQLAGSPTDNNATLFTKGQTEVLQPYIDSGKIKIVAQQGVDNWDPANAEKLMENILTAQQNKIDAVVASNDGTALGALQAMKAQGLAGKVPISGQDATADGVNSIIKGELTVSILKDIRNLAPQAVDLMDGLLKGTPPTLQQFTLAELTVDPSKTGNVQALFLPVQQVTKANAYDLVVKSGFQSYDDVYRDIPDADRPPKPDSTSGAGGTGSVAPGTKIGISMSDFATERWKKESDLMSQLLKAKGYDVVVQEANHDVKLQNDQIDNMVAQGVKGLIVVAEDGDAAATAVDKAAAAGVKVIAYDRLIKTSNIAAYLSFDNVEVGRQQAEGIMKAIDADNWDVATKGPAKVVQLAGSPTDNNATLFTKGQTEVLQPYIDSGKIKIVAQQGVDNWDPANAEKLMENILTAQQNKIDAVVASNDGTALGALQAMKAQGLAGKVPISGQDATADGVNSIIKGELTVSILKDIRNLAPQAVDLMDGLLKGQPPSGLKQFTLAELTVDPSKTGNVQALFLPVQQVTKANAYDLVVKSGFQSYDDVYRDIPDADRPPKP